VGFHRTMVMFPKHTPDGLKVMYYGFNERNSHLFRPIEIYKRIRLILDIYQKKGIDFTGIHVVIDTRNLSLSNISQFDLFQLKNLIKHAQVGFFWNTFFTLFNSYSVHKCFHLYITKCNHFRILLESISFTFEAYTYYVSAEFY